MTASDAEHALGAGGTSRLGAAAGALVLLLVALVMLRWSWLKWPDVLIDFGEVMYVPWQISEGRVLYRDMAYYYGPLAPYAIALWFCIFGVSVMTLVATNLVVLACITALLYRLLLRMAGVFAATLGGIVFLVLFAFPQLVSTGNYNYVTPYEANATYAIMLCLVALELVARLANRASPRTAGWIGLCVGAVFLTKPEMFLAIAVACALGIGLVAWLETSAREQWVRMGAAFAGATLVAPIACVILLWLAMPLSQATLGMLGAWQGMFTSDVSQLLFFQAGMGTDDVARSVAELARWLAGYAALLVPAALLALALRAPKGERVRTALYACLAFVVTLAGLHWASGEMLPYDFGRPLPVLLAMACGLVATAIWIGPQSSASRQRLILMLSSLVFALVLLLKMILNARVRHYGFVLAMPATVLVAVALVDWIPAWIRSRGGLGEVFAAVALAAIAVVLQSALGNTPHYFAVKAVPVGSGPDRFLADVRGPYVNLALAEIDERAQPGETLMVMPEGVMLNYLARRRNPTPYVNLNPTGMAIFGEQSILRALERDPPDWIALVDKDTSEFGVGPFGRGYAREIDAWVDAHYRKVKLIGRRPLRGEGFGILLLQRDDDAVAELDSR